MIDLTVRRVVALSAFGAPGVRVVQGARHDLTVAGT